MEASKLKDILDRHQLWLNGKGGKCANLKDADLCGAYLRDANLIRANLVGADLTRANLQGANLVGADLTRANLQGADLTDAYLLRANLACANLIDANLTGANLSGADLTRADLTRADLYRADLQYANLKDAILPDVSWIIPGCLVQLNRIKYNGFWLMKERKWVNFVQDIFGFIVQNNGEEDTFDMLVEDRIIRNIPNWVKYSGLKQIASE